MTGIITASRRLADSWQLGTTLSSSSYLWLWPISKKIRRNQYALAPGRVYEIVLDTRLDGKSLQVEFLAEAYDREN